MRCDLCGGTDFREISDRDRHGEELHTGICTGCGLVSHLPLPSEEEIAAYYAERYRRDYHGETTPSPRRVMRAWRNGERIHRLLAPHLPAGAGIFEVGAGIGCTVKVFETHGYSARGIEPNRDFNRFTRERLGAEVANRNLFELEPEPRFDAVLLVHVIEHFTSPSRALAHIRELLREGGRLYVECPNLTAPFATFGRMFHFAHIYNFTPTTLTALARKCGFAVEQTLSGEDDPDIRILFRKAEPAAPDVDAGHTGYVLDRIHRHNLLTYHLRPRYLARRLCKLAGYAGEALLARGFVRRLLRRIETER